MLSRLASGLVFCCLVSACIFLPWLLCTCVLLCRMLGLFGASPGPLLGPILALWRAMGAHWGHSWRLLGLSWPAPGLLPASLGPSWRLLGRPLGRLGRLLTAESEFSRNPVKTKVFAWFLHDFGAFWGPPGPLFAALGWSWVALGRS